MRRRDFTKPWGDMENRNVDWKRMRASNAYARTCLRRRSQISAQPIGQQFDFTQAPRPCLSPLEHF